MKDKALRRHVTRRGVVLLIVAVCIALGVRQYVAAWPAVPLRTFAGNWCGVALLKGVTLTADPSDPRQVWVETTSGFNLLWPKGTRVVFGSPATIVTAFGSVAARVGEPVDLTGGYFVGDAFSVCWVNGRWPWP